MNIDEATKQLNELVEAWDLDEASLNQTDIDAIKIVLKELSLKDGEYNVLRITDELKEEEQQKEINKLQEIRNKAKDFLWNYLNNTIKNPDDEDFIADDDIGFAYKILKNEEEEKC